MQSFHSYEEQLAWLQLRDVFHRCLAHFSKVERAVAMCVYDADLTGLSMTSKKFDKIAKISSHYYIDKMKKKVLRLVKEGKI